MRFLRRAIHRGLVVRLAERSALPLGRLWVLSTLHRNPVGSQAELAELLYTDAPTLSRTLDKLEADGMVARLPGEDRRKFRLALTPAGVEEALKVEQALEWVDARVAAHLTAEESAELERLLAKAALALGPSADLRDP